MYMVGNAVIRCELYLCWVEKKLCSGLINIHYVKDGIHSCHVLKSEILVVKNHPLITMLLRHMLYVGGHTYWYDNLTTIGEHDTELATHIEIKPLDSNIYIRNLTHSLVFI